MHTKTDLLPDLQFLIACCQTNPSDDDIKRIHQTLPTKDHQHLINLALRHGILPLVYLALKGQSSKQNSSRSSLNAQRSTLNAFLSKLKTQYIQIAQRNMLMSAELIRVMKYLEENGIKALAFKGPVLAQMAYRDITLRQYGDLDILIPPQDLFDTATLLLDDGYKLYGSIDFLNDPVWIEAAKDMTLFQDKKNMILEMHWKLFHSTFANTSHGINLWRKTEKIKINQVNILTLDRNLLLAYLCIHGSRHLWERLEWIVDIDRLTREIEINWSEVLEAAEQFQSKTMLLLGLSLSHLLLGTELPEEIRQMIQTKKIRRLTSIIVELLEKPLPQEPSTAEIMYRKKTHAAMQDSVYQTMIFWKNILFRKNDTIILGENQPNKHHSMFTLGRPYYLFKKFFLRQN